MTATQSKAGLIRFALATAVLLVTGGVAMAQTVRLTAAPTTATLPDGQTVPMWGLFCNDAGSGGASCAIARSPSTATPTTWAATTAYVLGAFAVDGSSPVTLSSTVALVTTAGTSGTVAPTFNTTPGATTTDGTVTWTTFGTLAQFQAGYSATWAPPVIRVAAGTTLTINLVNKLSFGPSADPNRQIPTSLVIVGQLGGGLGAEPQRVASPTHAPIGTTWFGTPGPTDGSGPLFTPPAQADRVRSFGTEVVTAGVTPTAPQVASGSALTWTSIRAGTYIIHSGTQPSIQHAMGLYGVVVVTEPDTGNPLTPTAYGQTFDKDAVLLLSEIDPVQNIAVDVAVRTTGFDPAKAWSAQTGECGDPAVHTCYPPAVNYSPLYFLVNGVSFDRTNVAASTQSILPIVPPATEVPATTDRVLLRMANAGQRMHIPAVVGLDMTLLAEDGNKLPGEPRAQSSVFLPAGKTYEVTVHPNTQAGNIFSLKYQSATYAVFDRSLSLSTNNQRDGGMQSYISIAGGAASGVGTQTGSGVALAGAKNLTYYCYREAPLNVSDPQRGLIGGVTGANGVVLGTFGGAVTANNLKLGPNGTFMYAAPQRANPADPAPACDGSFTFIVNGNTASPYTATIAECLSASCGRGNPPNAVADTYPSAIASRFQINRPGVLANDSDPSGLPLHAVLAGTSTCARLNADGSFVATGSATTPCIFSYRAVNSQNTPSATAATVTVNFGAPSNLVVNLRDSKTGSPIATNDYRWIIEEDRTIWIDPNIETTSTTPLKNVAINFHASHMPVVAQGCTGPVSCESGQTLLQQPAVCDVGSGSCRTTATQKTAVFPSQVHLETGKRYYISVLPSDSVNPLINDPPNDVGHGMGGAQINCNPTCQASVNVYMMPTPIQAAQISVFIFQDDNPLNGEADTGGGIDTLAPNEAGLGGFNIVILDQAGGMGDNVGQPTYDMSGQPLTNALAGKIDPVTGADACPITQKDAGPGGVKLVGMIVTCPKYESDGVTLSPLAGHALIMNMYPGLYEVQASPGTDRISKGEEWLQTNTLDGTKSIEAFIMPGEPSYFQEFGPGGYHVAMGFANPAIIKARKPSVCAGTPSPGCSANFYGQVSTTRLSRTPDQRVYGSGDYASNSYTQCYVSLGYPDTADFDFAKCDENGQFQFNNIPPGNFKITVFDQYNDLLVDGLTTPIKAGGTGPGSSAGNRMEIPVMQWRTNLYGRVFLDKNGDGVSQDDEPGLPLVPYNIRMRDGSYFGYNNTDLNGFAGFNEVFPILNWLVIDIDSARYKLSGVHVVYDAGGPADGTTGGGNSTIGASMANTVEQFPVPQALRVPNARYCNGADCPLGDNTGGSTGRVDPGWASTQGWQGLLGNNGFIEFAMKPFASGENGGIRGHVIYSSTRPFDDPQLLLQLSWEPGVAKVRINLYQKVTDDNGNEVLRLVDTTGTTSWDDWAQGFRRNPNNGVMTAGSGADLGSVPNMSCPGQDNFSPFYFTMKNGKFPLDPASTQLAYQGRYRCYDGWSMFSQIQPAPYNGMYKFPSIVAKPGATGALPTDDNWTVQLDPTTYKTNCHLRTNAEPWGCVANPADGTPMLPAGKYVVEMVIPPGYELVKEEDKNLYLGDAVIAALDPQFPEGFGAIFIMPDQAAVNSAYNPYNTLQRTTNNGAVPRHEGDTGSVETFWPCVGEMRVVPDLNSLYPGAQQQAPFAGASRALCDRKQITLTDQMTALAKFYLFSSADIASHFTGTITNDFASEFDPFSPQFGEKFAVPNVPIGIRDPSGREVARVYADQWGVYNGLNYSSWTVFPPSPSGYTPAMMIMCMNDPGPIPDPAHPGQTMQDPNYNVAYSNFCYETPYMPGQTSYLDTPVIPTMAFADRYNLPDCEYPDATPAIKSVVNTNIERTLPAGTGPWVSDFGGNHHLTITALQDKRVINNAYSGPNATTSPYNNKFITRHYGFGARCTTPSSSSPTCNTVSSVTIGGVNAPITSWLDGAIEVTVPTGVPQCSVLQRRGNGNPTWTEFCGELVVTAGNGKKSIDTVTVTVGTCQGGATCNSANTSKVPTVVTPTSQSISTFGHIQPNPLQTAIDRAAPGDLIIVRPGEYRENLLMWKPVRLQGVGAESVTINADAHPAGKFDAWRRQANCLFGLSLDGRPLLNDGTFPAAPAFDTTGTYTCPASMQQRVDRIPFETILGWDTTGNGNLAQMLQEPTLMGSYEGAGITALARGVRIPNNSSDFWGSGAAGGFPAGYEYLTGNNSDCNTASTTTRNGRDYGTSNFLCNPSRIDGLSVINSSQGGGAIWAHGWNHNLEISNTRVRANHGTFSGGITISAPEFPDPFIVGGTNPPPPGLPVTAVEAAIPGLQVGYGFVRNTKVHHNMVTANASLGDALFTGTPFAAGGISFCNGADGYTADHNWVCGNLSSGDAGGLAHAGFINNGTIKNNWILFNQSQNPTIPTHGGGIAVIATAPDATLPNGTECGGVNDQDCPPALAEGTGRNLMIDGNLIMGNSAESGTGGGIRLQLVNGQEVPAFPLLPGLWNDVTVQNNIITNNVAGWDGGGVSMQDALKVRLINNTIVSNDTTASAGVLFNTLGAPNAAVPPPNCNPQPDPNLPQDPSCINPVTTSTIQPAGVVTMANTPNMVAALGGLSVRCPAGYGYNSDVNNNDPVLLNGACRSVSLPLILNNILWQNRAFHVEVAPLAPPAQQAVATLVPSLNQPVTPAFAGGVVTGGSGACVANGTATGAPGSGGPVYYWDIGVRGDLSATTHESLFTLVPRTSALSSGNYTGNGNTTSNPLMIQQYCNGARVPPEGCANVDPNDPNGLLRCKGYNAPPGRSETTGTYPVFALLQTTVAATIDEGNNWINLVFGPLSLSSPTQSMLLGNYSIQSTSPAVVRNGGTNCFGALLCLVANPNNVVPDHDFFGTSRPRSAANGASIGAVELP